jgi:hypothetical protein
MLEAALKDADLANCSAVLGKEAVSHDLLASAFELKRAAAQINVLIHAVGILLIVPHVLKPNERITSLSLGAGNSGRDFDLETSHRIAEFKFSEWQGGADTIRENQLFKDFFQLAEYDTRKRKYLYVLSHTHAIRFLNGGRALDTVFRRNAPVGRRFQALYGDKFSVVRDYYLYRRNSVRIEDVGPLLSAVPKRARPPR